MKALIRAVAQRDEQAMETAADRMRAIDRQDTVSLGIVADHKEALGKRQAAFELRRQILTINPKDVSALRGVAEYWARRGEVDFACEAIRRAMEAAPAEEKRGAWVERILDALRIKPFQPLQQVRREMKRSEREWTKWAEHYLAVHGTSAPPRSEVVN